MQINYSSLTEKEMLAEITKIDLVELRNNKFLNMT